MLALVIQISFITPVQAIGDPYAYCNKVTLTVGSKTAYVNGRPKIMKTAPYIKSGKMIVPLRYVAGYLDAAVTYDSFMKGRTDVETGDGMIIEFLAGDKSYYVGDLSRRIDTHANAGWVQHTMDPPPVIKKDNLMYVPLRYLAEGIGASITYDSKSKSVTIRRIDTKDWKEYREIYTGTVIKYPHDWNIESQAFSLDIYKNGTEFIFEYESAKTPQDIISFNKSVELKRGWSVYREAPTYITFTKKNYDKQLIKIISTRKLPGGCLVYTVNTDSKASEWNLLIIDKMTPGKGI